MKILVTGATGFVGSALVRKLLSEGHDVRVLVRQKAARLNFNFDGVEQIQGSLSDLAALEAAVHAQDVVFHVAGVVAAKSRDEFFEANVEGTKNVLAAIQSKNPEIKKFIFVSSLAASGPCAGDHSRVEGDNPEPVSHYGRSKVEAEEWVKRSNFPYIIFRPPLVYGPNDRAFFTVIKTVARGFRPSVMPTQKGVQKTYSTIHIEDLTEALFKGMNERVTNQIYHVAANEFHTYDEILNEIAKNLGRKTLKVSVPKTVLKLAAFGLDHVSKLTGKSYPLNRDKLQEIFPDRWTCSNEKLKTELDFQPKYEFSDGIRETVDWYRKQGWL